MASKPSTLPIWADGAAWSGPPAGPIVEPLIAQKHDGFHVAAKMPAQWFNWLFNLIYLWTAYLADADFVADTGSARAGVSGTGDGTGAGVYGTGGATNGAGGDFHGSGDGAGVLGTGHGLGPGVYGVGGATDGFGADFLGGGTNGSGLRATGVGTGPGAQFYSGSGAGSYAVFAQSFTSTVAAIVGQGYGIGVAGLGGSNGATAGSFIAHASAGGNGVYGKGGGTGGVGGLFQRGDSDTHSPAIQLVGSVDMNNATMPTGTVAQQNKLHRDAFVKVSANCTGNSGGDPTVNESLNVTSVAQASGGTITITFAQAMSNTHYNVIPTAADGLAALWRTGTRNTTDVELLAFDDAGVQLTRSDMNGKKFGFLVFGAQ